jgi:hypothetical protein
MDGIFAFWTAERYIATPNGRLGRGGDIKKRKVVRRE